MAHGMIALLLLLQAVYTALKETESRATDVLPLWKVPALTPLIPRQRKALQAVSLIRQTTEELIAKCKDMVDAEEQVINILQAPRGSIVMLFTSARKDDNHKQSLQANAR